jgi:similar to bacteriophage protein. putative transmembrane protein
VLLYEFLYKIGFDVDSDKIKQIEQGLKNISSLAKQTAQPISDAVKAGMERNAELIAKLEQAKNQGVEWCEEAKGQAEELTTSFHKVAEAEKKVGEKAKEASKETKKLTEKKPAANLKQELSNIRSKFMLIGAAATAASGLIANYLTVPLQNIEELAKKKDRLFSITQNEINQAKEYQDQLQKTKTAVQSIVTQIALKLIPVANQSLKGFNNFLRANKALVVEGLTNVFKWILKLGQVFTNTFRFLNKVISSTIGWKAALLILVGVLAVVKRAMLAAFLTNPIGWVIMLIGGLILLIDDLMTYLDGGKSLFGDSWKPFIEWGKKAIAVYKEIEPIIKQVFSGAVKIIMGFGQSVIGILTSIGALFTLRLADLKEALQFWCNGGKKMIEGLCNIFGTSWSEVTEKVKKAIFAWIDDIKVGFENLGKAIMQPFELAFKWIKKQYDEYIAPIISAVKNFDIGQTASDMWEGAKSFLSFGNDTPKAALATQYADNNRSVQYNGGTATTTININTNNPQMANQIINNRQKNDLAFTQANLKGLFKTCSQKQRR